MKTKLQWRRLRGICILFMFLVIQGSAVFSQTNYYSKSTGNLNTLSTWGTNTNGTGSQPPNFTNNNLVFNVRNNATPTIGANWTVSGTNSKIIVGNGTNACDLIIPSNYTITGTVDIAANGTVTQRNAVNPTWGIISATSLVDYNGTVAQTIDAVNYGNLTVSGNTTSAKTADGSFNVAGTFTVNITGGSIDMNNGFFVTNTFGIKNLNIIEGSLNGGSGFTFGNISVLNLSGDLAIGVNGKLNCSAYFNYTQVNFSGTGNINIAAGGTGQYEQMRTNINSPAVMTLQNNWPFTNAASAALTIASGATLNASTYTLSVANTGTTFSINGLFRTANANGFNGATNTAINTVTNTPAISLGSTSLIEYNAATAQVITPFNYQNLTSTSTGSRTLSSSGIIGIDSAFTPGTNAYINTGSFISFNGVNNQSVPAFAFASLGVTNGNTKTLGGNVSVADTLSIGASTTFALSNFTTTLRSDTNKTARVAVLPSGAAITYGTGKFIVERFVAGRRAWRLLTAPVSTTGAPTIKASWMETGQITTVGGTSNPNAGFGTHITGGTVANGFDQNASGSPSCKEYISGVWTGIANASTVVTNQQGYMLFVRGSRANILTQGSAAPVDNTTLRVSGQIKTGNQSVAATGAGFKVVGNPYPSAVNFHTASRTGLPDTYYIWDPKLTGTNGVGGYITCSWNGTNYTRVPAPVSPVDANGTIQSGSAVMVNFTGAGNITFTESCKISGSALTSRTTTAAPKNIAINLLAVNNDGTVSLNDGTLAEFDGTYNSAIDDMDAVKLGNVAENIAVRSDDQNLSLERRGELNVQDTIHLSISQMSYKNYQLEIVPTDFNMPGTTAYLVDKFTGISTLLNLTTSTVYSFNVSSTAASYASDRFMITFKQATVLPVQKMDIAASLTAGIAAIKLTTENEINTAKFILERSIDNTNYAAVAEKQARGNYAGTSYYTYADDITALLQNPIVYYRVKQLDRDGRSVYSKVVVVKPQSNAIVKVWPTPFTDKLSVSLNSNTAYKTQLKLIDSDGKIVIINNYNIVRGINQFEVAIPGTLPGGVYVLKLIDNSGNISYSQKITKQ